MLQDPQAIRCYQKLTDSLVDLWNRGYSFDELRLYIDGYLSALKHTNTLESYITYRLEEDAIRYIAAIHRSYNLDSTNRLGSQ
ncbi:MAG: hypothetical protein F6K44_18090 [Moorea sp. SIO3E2]|nr:hypothetical protein [Moorena sp. SIO3E2]